MGHDAGDREAAERLTEQFRALDQSLRELIKHSNSTHQTITVSAGGIGVWICATLSAISFVMLMAMGFIVLDQTRKADRMQDYWNVTLQYVPGLKDHLNHDKEKAP